MKQIRNIFKVKIIFVHANKIPMTLVESSIHIESNFLSYCKLLLSLKCIAAL